MTYVIPYIFEWQNSINSIFLFLCILTIGLHILVMYQCVFIEKQLITGLMTVKKVFFKLFCLTQSISCGSAH